MGVSVVFLCGPKRFFCADDDDDDDDDDVDDAIL